MFKDKKTAFEAVETFISIFGYNDTDTYKDIAYYFIDRYRGKWASFEAFTRYYLEEQETLEEMTLEEQESFDFESFSLELAHDYTFKNGFIFCNY